MTIDDLSTVLEAVGRVRSKWYDIGRQLRLSAFALKTISKQNFNIEDCFRDMLTQWLRQDDPPPTWSALADALRSYAVGEQYLAEQIESKYILDVTDSGPATEVQEGESIG